MPDAEIVITRQELYERVWKDPIRTLAREFGLSDVGLSKLCRRHAIPVPERGHWSKLRHGKKVLQPPLPADIEPCLETVRIEPQLSKSVPIARPAADAPRIKVKKQVRSPHHLLARMVAWRREGGRRRLFEDGTVLVERNERGVYLPVSPLQLGRIVRIADTLFRELERRGYEVSLPQREYGRAEFDVTVKGQRISCRLRERLRMIRSTTDSYPRVRYEPSGVLELMIDCWAYNGRKTFADGKKGGVEDRLDEFLLNLDAAADAERIAAEERERKRREREEERRRRLEEEERQRREAEKGQELQEQALRWSRAALVDRYLEAVRNTLRDTGEEADPCVQEWLSWGETYSQRLCPIRSGTFGPDEREEEDVDY